MTDEAADETTPAPAGNLLPQLVGDEMRTSYINYAMSVIVGRALPDVRDGLKPVHRRVLFGMHEAGHSSERSYTKSARSVGEVMGKYHPHGDQSIYDTMVRMAQDFSLRYPLIDGQGNFGSIDGDPPAAMRYTESRLDRISKHMLEDIDKNTVDFQPNFDDSENEPSVLPARLPNLLLNGSDGIAVGMATKIPPHNLNEVTAAINMHVERILEGGEDKGDPERAPAITVKEYMAHLQGPDFPTGATVYGIDGITEMYEGGHGKFHIRSTCEVLDDDEGKRIIVTEIPYQVKKAAMLEGIAELVSKETVKGIRDLRDESSKEGIRVVIEIKQNADPHAVLNQLFKSSRLQESYSANMMGIIDSRPVELSLSIILHTYVRHRESVIERRTQYELDKAQARAHVLEGLVIAQQRIEDIIKVSRGSAGRENFEKVLRGEEKFKGVKKFSFSEPQSKAIAERRLYQLSRLDVKKVEDEFDQLSEAIEDFESILASRRKRLELLMDELRQMTEKHGDERRTHIDPKPLSMDREDLIEERAIVITLSEDNYIRHLPVDAFRLQNKGGKGLKGITTKNEDFPKCIITCFSKDRLLFFTDQGRVYGLKAWETPQASRQSRGSHFRNLLPDFREDERIVTILTISKDLVTPTEEVPEPWRDQFLMFATERGRIKKSELKHYAKINKNGKLGIKLADGDMLVSVRSAIDDDDVVMISNTGRACRFRPSELKPRRNTETGEIEHYLTVRPQGRVTRGVAGMSLNDDEDVVGLIVTSNQDTHVVTISKNGFAKRTRLGSGDMRERRDANDEIIYAEDGLPETERDGYRKTNRASKGVKTMNLKDGDQIVRCHQMDDLQDQLFILSAKGMMIRIIAAQARHTAGRATLGGRVMNLRDVNKKYIDEVIFSARLPADLVDEDDIPAHLQELGEEE